MFRSKYKYIIRQIYAASISNFQCFFFGINFAFATNVIYQLEQIGIVTENDSSEIGGSGFLLAFVSSVVGGQILDKYGRKSVILLVYFFHVIGWFIIATFESIVVGRYIISLGVGMGFLSTVYTTEIAEPKYRSILSLSSSLYELCGTCGISLVLYFFSWQVTSIGLSITSVIFFLSAFFIPETPYWLILKNKKEEAKELIIWLRGDSDEISIVAEIQEISDSIQIAEKKSQKFWKVLCSWHNWKILFLLGTYNILLQLIGYDMITPYSVQFFDTFNRSAINSRILTILCSVTSFIGVSMSMCFLEKFNRKIVVNFANAVNGLFLAIAAIQLTFFPGPQYSIVSALCIEGYHLLIQIGTVYLPWTIISECLPNENRGVLFAVLCSEVLFLIYIISQIFPKVLATIAINYILWAFCACSVVTISYVHFLLPETRGKVMGEHRGK